MIYLLDTHTLIWAIIDSPKLSKKVLQLLKNESNKIYVSVISYWEISLKTSINKFSFTGLDIKEIPIISEHMGFSILPLESDPAISFSDLPLSDNHKDPFDRMLVWQAICIDITLISKDASFKQYTPAGLKLVW